MISVVHSRVSFCFICILLFLVDSKAQEESESGKYFRGSNAGRHLSVETVESMNPSIRQLIGSNCLYIEKGEVPPYWDCEGCIVEEAQGCVDDMRYDKGGRTGIGCNLNSAGEVSGHRSGGFTIEY